MNLLLGNVFRLLRRKSSRRTSNQCRKSRHFGLVLESLEARRLLSVVSLTPVKDNTIYSNSGTLSDGKGLILIGLNGDGTTIKRGLVDFDLTQSGIPAGSTINSVTLTMWLNKGKSGTPVNVELHKVQSDWGEAARSNASAHPGQAAAARPATPHGPTPSTALRLGPLAEISRRP